MIRISSQALRNVARRSVSGPLPHAPASFSSQAHKLARDTMSAREMDENLRQSRQMVRGEDITPKEAEKRDRVMERSRRSEFSRDELPNYHKPLPSSMDADPAIKGKHWPESALSRNLKANEASKPDAITAATDSVSATIEPLQDGLAKAQKAAAPAMQQSKAVIQKARDEGLESLQGGIEKAQKAATPAMDQGKAAIQKAKDEGLDSLKTKSEETMNQAREKSREMYGNLKDQGQDRFGQVQDKASEQYEEIQHKTQEALKATQGEAQKTFDSAKEKSRDMIGKAKDQAQKSVSDVKTAVTENASSVWSQAKKMFSGGN